MVRGEHDSTEKDLRALVEDRLAEADALASAVTGLEGAVNRLNNPLAALMLDLEQLCEQLVYVMPAPERAEAARVLGDARAEALRIVEGIRDLAKLLPRDPSRSVDFHDLIVSTLHLVERQYGGRVCVHRKLVAEGPVVTRPSRLALLLRSMVQQVVADARAPSLSDRVDIEVTTGHADGAVTLRVGARSRGLGERGSLVSPSIAPPRMSIPPTALEVAHDPVLAGLSQQLGGSLHMDRGHLVLVLPVSMPPSPEAASVSRKRPSAPELGEIRILVVDDEVSIQRSLARALRELGMVQAVSSVRSAIELLAGGAVFDVVLCDVVMPEGSGIELVSWMQENRPRLKRRVVLMSGLDSTHADAHPEVPTIQKPFDLRKLRELVCDLAVRA
ncbi:MAG: hypothetical protein RL385_5297 [Pseudomonadota bacterium]|jgi:CheY-like chemotaxis protein